MKLKLGTVDTVSKPTDFSFRVMRLGSRGVDVSICISVECITFPLVRILNCQGDYAIHLVCACGCVCVCLLVSCIIPYGSENVGSARDQLPGDQAWLVPRKNASPIDRLTMLMICSLLVIPNGHSLGGPPGNLVPWVQPFKVSQGH